MSSEADVFDALSTSGAGILAAGFASLHWLLEMSDEVIEKLYGEAGRARSGASARGSQTDPNGPDASEHTLRFFLEQPRSDAAG